MQVVVHRPRTHDGWLWIRAELAENDVVLEVHDAEGVVVLRRHPDDGDPDHVLANVAPRTSDTRIWWVSITGLRPDRDYTVRHPVVTPTSAWARWIKGRSAATPPPVIVASSRTLPTTLRGDPFRVLLASCYCEYRHQFDPSCTNQRPETGPAPASRAVSPLAVAARPPWWSGPLLPEAVPGSGGRSPRRPDPHRRHPPRPPVDDHARTGPGVRKHTLHELVSSPLTVWPGAGSAFGSGDAAAFPLGRRRRLGVVTFTNPLEGTGDPSYTSPWWFRWRQEPCHDHFMTPEFSLTEPAGARSRRGRRGRRHGVRDPAPDPFPGPPTGQVDATARADRADLTT